jgi:hypothetical protein
MTKKEKKPASATAADWHTGLTGDEDLPGFLDVKNRTPLTAAQAARLAEVQAAAKVDTKPATFGSNLPRGIEDDPIAMAMLENEQAKKQAAKTERLAALKASKGPAAKSVRGSLLDAHYFAKVIGCPAKLVRRALRTTKAIKKPAWGWAFTKDDEAQVIAVVKGWLAKVSGKPKGRPAKAKAATVAPKAAKPTTASPKAVKPTPKAVKAPKAPKAAAAATKAAKPTTAAPKAAKPTTAAPKAAKATAAAPKG